MLILCSMEKAFSPLSFIIYSWLYTIFLSFWNLHNWTHVARRTCCYPAPGRRNREQEESHVLKLLKVLKEYFSIKHLAAVCTRGLLIVTQYWGHHSSPHWPSIAGVALHPPGPPLAWPAQALGSLHLAALAWCRWARKEQEHSRRCSRNHLGQAGKEHVGYFSGCQNRSIGLRPFTPEVAGQLDALAQPYPLPWEQSSSWLCH